MILSLLCAADFMISDLSTCAWNQRGGGEENNSPLLDSHFFHSNFPAPNKSFFFFFVQMAAKSWSSDSWMMSRIFFAASRIIILAPPTLLLFSKHRRVSANIILEMNPFVTTSTQMQISQNSLTNNTRRMRGGEGKKESHPWQDYCKSFEAAERKQRRKRSRNRKTRENSTPTHSF